jgi:hypothetical protein
MFTYFYGHLEYFMDHFVHIGFIWYIFFQFWYNVPRNIWQPWNLVDFVSSYCRKVYVFSIRSGHFLLFWFFEAPDQDLRVKVAPFEMRHLSPQQLESSRLRWTGPRNLRLGMSVAWVFLIIIAAYAFISQINTQTMHIKSISHTALVWFP